MAVSSRLKLGFVCCILRLGTGEEIATGDRADLTDYCTSAGKDVLLPELELFSDSTDGETECAAFI